MAAANHARCWWRLLLGVFLAVAFPSVATARERVDVPSRPGVTQPIFLTAARSPWASAILFPGGSGRVTEVRNNFLIRVAPRFAALGVTVAVIDTPSDHIGGVDTSYRAGEAAATDTAAVVTWLKSRATIPVWLVGTSRGSISAANAALRLGPATIAGVVLTSSVWSDGMEAVPLDKMRIPVLVVHNRDDTCGSSPFAGATRGYDKFGAASAKAFVTVSGGSLRGDPCGAMSPHGYLGIEDQVISSVVTWIRAH
jgi:alpha/beta superfamily hydrolase